MDAYAQITTLLNRYAEHLDSGDFQGAATLFEHAQLQLDENTLLRGSDILNLWRQLIIVYPDGTPRTKHVVTNPIIDIDESAGTAVCRSYYTVLQQTDDFPLQVVVTGRYHDRFARAEGRWRFTYRDYSLIDQVGDLSRHLARSA